MVAPPAARSVWLTAGSCVMRQRERESAAAVLPFALGAHHAAVQLDEPSNDRQPQARAAVASLQRRLDLVERIPDPRQLVLGDAHAAVLDRHPHLVALPAAVDAHEAAGRAELHAIAHEMTSTCCRREGSALTSGRSLATAFSIRICLACAATVTTALT